MEPFKKRLAGANASGRRVMLACDYIIDPAYGAASAAPAFQTTHGPDSTRTIHSAKKPKPPDAIPLLQVIRDIKNTSAFLCAIKINYHLLLPLGAKHVSKITDAAHRCGLQAVADIKLNDIGNTNGVATGILWEMGFDAVIANPIMGLEGLRALVHSAHKKQKGVITLCHMSAPEARMSYEMSAYATSGSKKPKSMHEIFLDWALDVRADGIIVGATFPDVIRDCSRRITRWEKRHHMLGPMIISPGVGAQGADAAGTINAGSDCVIAGRSVINSLNPADAARLLYQETSMQDL